MGQEILKTSSNKCHREIKRSHSLPKNRKVKGCVCAERQRASDMGLLSKSETRPPDSGELGSQENNGCLFGVHTIWSILFPETKAVQPHSWSIHRKKILNVVFGRWKSVPSGSSDPQCGVRGRREKTTVDHCHQALDGRAVPRARCAASGGEGVISPLPSFPFLLNDEGVPRVLFTSELLKTRILLKWSERLNPSKNAVMLDGKSSPSQIPYQSWTCGLGERVQGPTRTVGVGSTGLQRKYFSTFGNAFVFSCTDWNEITIS